MPYKFTESRRHKFAKARYRVTNWPEYDAALLRRGSVTVWFTEEAVAAWHAPATGKRGGQPVYSATAIETYLALRLVFHQPLRQTEGLLRSIVDVLGVDINVPDHTTLSRRGGGLAILPKRLDRGELLHLLVDSTGLKIFGEGEWLDQKHGIRSRRRWRKLRLGIDAVTHEIVASELTPDDVGDVSEIPDLLDQIESSTLPRWRQTARMMARRSTMPLPSGTPKLRLSFHRGPLPFQVKQQRHNAIDISRRSQSMAGWDGSVVRATISAAWSKPRCFATKLS